MGFFGRGSSSDKLSDKLKGAEKVFDAIFNSDAFKDATGLTLDEVAKLAEKQIGKAIEDKERTGLTYIAGKFRIVYVDEKSFRAYTDLYFQDAAEEWHNVNGVSKLQEADSLNRKAWQELKLKKEVSYDYEKEADSAFNNGANNKETEK